MANIPRYGITGTNKYIIMTNKEHLKVCLIDVLADPTEYRVIVETALPLLEADECNKELTYLVDLSDGDGTVFDKFHVSANNGNGVEMTLPEVLEYFGEFINSDIVSKIYVDCY